MLIEHEGKRPRVAASAYVAPTAVVSGDVSIGERSTVLFGAVLTADGGPVELGAQCVVMENALVRGRAAHPARLGDRILVGPHAHLNGAVVESDVFLATGVSIFPGTRIETGSEVRINGIVHVNTRLPAGTTVPIGWVAVGDPASILPPDQHEKIWEIQKPLNFPLTVYGLAREEADMVKITRRLAANLASHREDEPA